MVERDPNRNNEELFAHELMREYANAALTELSGVFLDETEEITFRQSTDVLLRTDNERGSIIPDTRYDAARRAIEIVIEPRVLEEYSEDVSGSLDEARQVDVIKVLIGAGVAKSMLGWKMTQLDLEQPGALLKHTERICQKDKLWNSADEFDDVHHTNIRRAVERLGDDELMRINWLRFSLGASLRYVSAVPDLQVSLVELMQKELLAQENMRAVELDYGLRWLEADSAFANYDSKVPLIELAFSFPMSPAEEQQFVQYN